MRLQSSGSLSITWEEYWNAEGASSILNLNPCPCEADPRQPGTQEGQQGEKRGSAREILKG
jgi:hypothetical protein